MKRTTLTRKSPPKRTKPVRRRNAKRAAARLTRDFGPQAKLCREMPCCIHTLMPQVAQDGPTEPHHEPSRGAGGHDEDTLPLCRGCHRLRHSVGVVTFWGDYDWRSLRDELRQRAAELDERGFE